MHLGSQPSASCSWRWISAACVILVMLRVLQLLSYAPMLYGWEFAQFGQLAFDISQGHVDPAPSIGAFLARYQYGSFAQGTLVPVFGAVVFSWLGFGPTIWALHAVAITSEVFTFVLVLVFVTNQIKNKTLCLLAAALWIFGSTFTTAWQLMPYGNHTGFLWIPILLVIFLIKDPNERPWFEWVYPMVIVAIGYMMYRLNLAAILAFGGVLFLHPGQRAKTGGIVSVLFGLLIAIFTLWALGLLGNTNASLDHRRSLLPWINPANMKNELPFVWVKLWWLLPTAPQELGGMWQTAYKTILLASIPIGLVLSFGKTGSKNILRFPILWACFALIPLMISDVYVQRYYLNGYYALILGWIGILANIHFSNIRPVIVACAVFLIGCGIWDNAAMVRPEGFVTSLHYDGFRLWRLLGLHDIDPDEIPFYNRLMKEGNVNQWIMAASTSKGSCYGEPMIVLRHKPMEPESHLSGLPIPLANAIRGGMGRVPAPNANLFSGWSTGGLTRAIEQARQEFPNDPPDLEAIGRGAWIVCERSFSCLETALEKLPTDQANLVMNGAKKESWHWEKILVVNQKNH
ncbi:MAG: hypothetical protein UU48_C0004G0036 [Candidatus Uhrbacteria bacterium GW2011_GWF2_41_16]|uniref:Glycosyltransferase RgtA/B/C/D-like domain-containing protein n=2 Tax=Candidatus Uhriibacteriota TaxID=1752732 RepID=A0A0G0VBE7_9BACT|nr:MAG: hypothetical protein UU35_C0013G0008 [Candidatus Uhrbacteria bacterium GW2011_GWC2_41_11]KKR98243.1 MAG: hypothetical protein UU48_C0004G0036 [Candidatus Uhrbacteria bacterium GW2011_GWF2_41_16]